MGDLFPFGESVSPCLFGDVAWVVPDTWAEPAAA